MSWRKAKRKPILVEFREPEINYVMGTVQVEVIHTSEGTVYAVRDIDYVVRTEYGEIYPIKKQIFNDTYEVVD